VKEKFRATAAAALKSAEFLGIFSAGAMAATGAAK